MSMTNIIHTQTRMLMDTRPFFLLKWTLLVALSHGTVHDWLHWAHTKLSCESLHAKCFPLCTIPHLSETRLKHSILFGNRHKFLLTWRFQQWSIMNTIIAWLWFNLVYILYILLFVIWFRTSVKPKVYLSFDVNAAFQRFPYSFKLELGVFFLPPSTSACRCYCCCRLQQFVVDVVPSHRFLFRIWNRGPGKCCHLADHFFSSKNSWRPVSWSYRVIMVWKIGLWPYNMHILCWWWNLLNAYSNVHTKSIFRDLIHIPNFWIISPNFALLHLAIFMTSNNTNR